MKVLQNSSTSAASLAENAGKRHRSSPWGYLFVLPVLVFLGIFTFYPFLRSIYLTFFIANNNGKAVKFVGLDNWIKLLSDPTKVWTSVVDTMRYAVIICAVTFSLSMFLAYLCVDKVRGSRIYQTMFSMPLAIATAPIAAVGAYIFGKFGMINGILGTSYTFLGDVKLRFICTIILVCWCNCGSGFIYLLVGFRNVPEDVVECADLDGAGPLTKFFKIYVPVASPQIFYVLFLNILTAFKSFTMIQILHGTDAKGLRVLGAQVYYYAIVSHRFETACVYSLVLFLIIFVLTRIQLAFEDRLVYYQ